MGTAPDGTQGADRVHGAGAGSDPPPAPDRPFVDGTAQTSQEIREEIRTEVEALDQERRSGVGELRDDVAATVGELSRRMDVPARLRAGRDDAVAAVQRRAGTARAPVLAAASAAAGAVRRQPRAAVAGVGVLVLALLAARRYASRRTR